MMLKVTAKARASRPRMSKTNRHWEDASRVPPVRRVGVVHGDRALPVRLRGLLNGLSNRNSFAKAVPAQDATAGRDG